MNSYVGWDRYDFPGANEFVCGDGVDTILDYNPAQGDIISNDCEIINTK